MRFKSAVLGMVFAMAPVFPALAQQAGSLGIVNFQQPKPGMTKQYEAARKKHMGWHKAQKDAWSWYTWEVVSGEATGTYVTGSFGHAWKDLDGRVAFDKGDIADIATSVGPTLASSSLSYFVERADISLSPSTPSSTPAPLLALTFYHLKPDSVNDFIDSVKKVNEGVKKTNYAQAGPSHWFQLVNGGEGPLFVLVGDRADWASFQGNPKTLDVMMEEAYGKEAGAAILATLRKSFHTIHSSAHQYRPDLSYIAPK
jgi:hypothetical protein